MKRLTTGVAIAIAVSATSGCGWLFGRDGYFRDKQDDYQRAQAVSPLKVPEGLNARPMEDMYAVPPGVVAAAGTAGYEVPRPSAMAAENTDKSVRIHKMGDEQWVLVDYSPSQVWPRLKQFLSDNRIELEREDVINGTLDTRWLLSESDAVRRERFRVRIEQGVQPNSSELHVLQAQSSKGDDIYGWPAKSDNQGRERWMLDELANYLASGSGQPSVSLLAQGISTASKVSLVPGPEGRSVIRLELPYERAWASLGLALERSKFKVKDLDRSSGVYFANYRPDLKEGEEEPGFFYRMFNWWGDKNPLEGTYRLDVKDHGKWVEISLKLTDDSEKLTNERNEDVLTLIKSNLS